MTQNAENVRASAFSMQPMADPYREAARLKAERAQDAESVLYDIAWCRGMTGVKEDAEKMERLLREGWEPFAVTGDGSHGYTYHFRRPAQIDGADDPEEVVDPWVQDELDRMD